MFGWCGVGSLAGIALVDPGKFDCFVGNGLHGALEPFHLAAVFCACRCDMKRQQMASVSTIMWIFVPFFCFSPS